MSRKELEIEATYAAQDEDGFSPEDQFEYETWLDSLPADAERLETAVVEIEYADEDLPF